MAVTKGKTKASHLSDARAKKGKDLSPKWAGCEDWSADQFYIHFRNAMDYYRMESSGRELKPQVITWMSANGYTKDQIKAFKNTKDYRSNSTMGSIAACLNRGMPPVRKDFNEGRDSAQWLRNQIAKVIAEGREDAEPESEEDAKDAVVQPSIQDRLRDAAVRMAEEIDDAIESFLEDPDKFDPKAFKLVNLLRGRQVKAAHARIIKDFYNRNYQELQEAALGKDEQLKEAYAHLTKKQLKNITDFYGEIIAACDMLAQEAKVNRKPRAKKVQPKEKIVAKIKYAKSDEKLKLVSINPTDIIGSKELWVFNTKTRKLGKYVAAEYQDLGIKGASIVGFDENQSVQKTLRKPEEQLKEFKTLGKVALRKFLENIKAVDIKLNGRINEDTILLKVQ